MNQNKKNKKKKNNKKNKKNKKKKKKKKKKRTPAPPGNVRPNSFVPRAPKGTHAGEGSLASTKCHCLQEENHCKGEGIRKSRDGG